MLGKANIVFVRESGGRGVYFACDFPGGLSHPWQPSIFGGAGGGKHYPDCFFYNMGARGKEGEGTT
jgi:hypothetical protein